jgi:predicted DNA-binding transcriptional regulator AlpA
MDLNDHPLHQQDEFLAPRDVICLLRISRSAFWKWVKNGYLPEPSIRVGKMPRWSKRDILMHLKSHP